LFSFAFYSVAPEPEEDVYYRCHPATYTEEGFRKFAVPRLEYSTLPEQYAHIEEISGPSSVFAQALDDYITDCETETDEVGPSVHVTSPSMIMEWAHGLADIQKNMLLQRPTSVRFVALLFVFLSSPYIPFLYCFCTETN
jgi:hypothetical protein